MVHRLGLIPIKIDPRLFNEKQPDEEFNENNCVKFKLNVKCQKKQQYKNLDKKSIEKMSIDEVYDNTTIFSNSLEWIPVGNQKNTLNIVKPVHDDIIIAKLRENQEIEAELICEKGIGKTHAKWSPVATAYYMLMPDIEFKKKVLDENVNIYKMI